MPCADTGKTEIPATKTAAKMLCLIKITNNKQWLSVKTVYVNNKYTQKPRAKQILFALLKSLSSKDWTHPTPLHPLWGISHLPGAVPPGLVRAFGSHSEVERVTVYADEVRISQKPRNDWPHPTPPLHPLWGISHLPGAVPPGLVRAFGSPSEVKRGKAI